MSEFERIGAALTALGNDCRAVTALDAPIDPALLDRAAEAAYKAAMNTVRDMPRFEPWATLPEYWKRLYRVQAGAVITLMGGVA